MPYQPKATTAQEDAVTFLQAESTAGRISPAIQCFVYYFDPEVVTGYPAMLMIVDSEAPKGDARAVRREKVSGEFTMRVMVIWPNLQEAQKVLRRTAWQVIHAINRADNSLPGHWKWIRTRYHVRRHDDKPLFTADITYEVDYTETFTEDIEA